MSDYLSLRPLWSKHGGAYAAMSAAWCPMPTECMDVTFGDDTLDQRNLLFQSVARLEPTVRNADEAGQYAVVFGCVAQLNKMIYGKASAVTPSVTPGTE